MERIDAIMRDPMFGRCLEKNARAEAEREFCGHGLQHLVDVARITYILALESGFLLALIDDLQLSGLQAAREVVYAAGLLHDIGRWKQYESGGDHGELGAELAGEILERSGFAPREAELVTGAIRRHGEEGGGGLGELLHRADSLSRTCSQCAARERCYKLADMETSRLALIY